MRAINNQSNKQTANKTWNWNSAIVAAEQAREKEVREAQRRFRNAV